ncbi:MAG: CHAT domain-containing protein, partial [Bacteroidota bacterium]
FNNEQAHKGLLLRSTNRMKSNILKGKDEALKSKYIEWTGIKQELARLYSMPVSARYDSTKTLEEKANLLEKELVSRSADLNPRNEITVGGWYSVRNNLKQNEAAIEFVKYTPSPIPGETTDEGSVYAALVVRPGYKQPEMISLCAEQKLLNLMQNSGGNKGEFIAGLYTRGAGISATKKIPIADSLYVLVWKPLLSTLSGATTIYYSPAGLLHQISFPAIPNEKSELLCDLYDLRCVSSTSVLAEKNRKSGKPGSLCLFGGIAYDADSVKLKKLSKQYRSGDETEIASLSTESNTRGSNWSYLPGTLTEVKDIYALADKNKISTKLYAGENATEECFKSFTVLGSADVIHFATHGFFFPDPEKNEKPGNAQSIYRTNEDPLFRSGLLMAGANNTWKGKPVSGIEDGILTAYEVSNVNLENTRLVVLSACETGLGDIRGSEGVYGLQRAFKMAGVEYIIMSLWQVPDKETAEFMNLFYTNWFQNGDIRAAFSQTQRAMRKKYSAFFWAGFVLVE